MITPQIGRTFLYAYNKKYRTDYSAKQFFTTVYWQLFYNHPKYMQWVTNSPFVQMKKGQTPRTLNVAERNEKLMNLFDKIEKGVRDASIVIGFPASEEKEFATTSGLVTDISNEITDEEVYLSWIGGALGIGVAGGLSILFDNPEILLTVFEGWYIYRQFLNDPSIEKLSGNKINSWNGQWLNYKFGKYQKNEPDFSMLTQKDFFHLDKKSGKITVQPIRWSRLFFSLSRQFENTTLVGYVYSLGQTNKTIGFIPFRFEHATYLAAVYRKLFGNFSVYEQQEYENMMGVDMRRACEFGSIGIQALRPKDLEKYFKDSNKTLKFSDIAKVKKGESDTEFSERLEKIERKRMRELITFRAYKAWMVAMITKNKEEILDYTTQIAISLGKFQSEDKKTSTKRGHLLKELFSSTTKKTFLEKLNEILMLEDNQVDYLKELRNRVYLMNNEDFGYFVTLLRFDYTYQNKQQQ